MKTMVQLALLTALIIVMSAVPWLGYINLGFINATTVGIPVLIGGILMGPKAGAFLGGVFGVTSLLKNTFSPNLSSFVFSPFYRVGEMGGNFWSVVIALVPRILMGLLAGWLYQVLTRLIKTRTVSIAAAAVAGSLCNTALVMAGIYIFFGPQYAEVQNVAYSALSVWILTLIGTVGVSEALVCGVLVTAVCRTFLGVRGRNKTTPGSS